ncbi:MAG: hypothetical protein ABMA64_14465 [Myxococcota bacterium]
MTGRDPLAERIAAFVDAALGGAPHEPFDGLALAVHRWQREHDRVLAALTEGEPAGWRDIPAVPVSLFRDLPVGTFRVTPGAPGVVFRTSGTTTGGRGEHHLRSTALYDRGAIGWAARSVPGLVGQDTAALLEDPARAPDSSLSHMVSTFGSATWHVSGGVLDVDGLNARVREAVAPLFVPSTGFALADWLARGPTPLPPGSILMVTGGFKGRVVSFEPEELFRAARDHLRPARFVTEYGMTELSSQLWGTPELPYLPPPWLRAVAIDPDGRPVGPGERGQLRFYDLCNLDSTLGVETMDEGVVDADGTVRLVGRLSGSELRGCSLTIEEGWTR